MIKYYFKYVAYLIVATVVISANAGAYEDFYQAVGRDDERTVSQLLQRGFDPNSRSPEGQTGLHLALRDTSPRVADTLWAHPGLDVNALNAAGESPLMMAALRGDLAWAQRLIDRGARLEVPGWTPLHYAATGPETKMVALLLDKGAAIEARSPNKTTPLMMASRYGPESSVDLLLARGANWKLRNDLDLDAAAFARLASREALTRRLEALLPR